jgi:rod shape-determining protein MreD
MKKLLIMGAFIMALLVLQSTVFAMINYRGIHADLLFLLVISGSLLKGKSYGAVLGFAAGLVQDLASGTFFGSNTLVKLIIGYGLGFIEKQVYKDFALLPVLVSVVATAAGSLLMALIVFLLGNRFDFFDFLLYMMLPAVIQNMIFIYPIHRLLRFILDMRE